MAIHAVLPLKKVRVDQKRSKNKAKRKTKKPLGRLGGYENWEV